MRPAVTMANDGTLAEQVSLLTGEVKVLRESVDELKTALEWALRNARIAVHFDEAVNATPDRVAEPDARPTIDLFEIGDGVNFEKGGVDCFGEIIALNDGENVATVQIVPTGETMDVNQDHLNRLENDPLSYRSSKTVRETIQTEKPKSQAPKSGRQLTLDFESQTTCEMIQPFAAAEPTDDSVLSKEAFKARTRAIWDAVNAWIIEFSPSIEFDAHKLGVYEKIKPASQGSFSDEDQERLLKDDYALACGVAIAVEDASILMEDHGHTDDAESLTRAYYLAIALKTADFDLEHYLPGFPVHSLERL